MPKRLIAGCFTALAIVIVAVGVLRERREVVQLAPTGLTAPVAIRWEPSLEKLSEQIMQAMDTVNGVAECPLLTVAEDGQLAAVTLLTTGERSPCPGQRVEPIGEKTEAAIYPCRPGVVDMALPKLGHIQETYLALAHEFGHLFGLPHGRGLMAASPSWAPPLAFPLPTFTEPEERALKAICPKKGTP